MAEDIFNSLFSQDDLDAMEASQISSRSNGPVTVLGITFDNDEARRAYFKEELRKKLPELKSLEGFPIGDDDDIIALSDPPYYTACPNPWLNEFIALWEEEKQKHGYKEKIVTEPYASDVSEGRSNPVYVAHSYHTKVPHPAIMRYLLHYTQPGDIVFDGFAGTGMTGVAASLCGSKSEVDKLGIPNAQIGARHCICGDLSPFATNISQGYNLPCDTLGVKKELRRIYEELRNECSWMYEVEEKEGGPKGYQHFIVWSDVFACSNCGNEYSLWDVELDRENKCLRDKYACPYCGVQQESKTSQAVRESYYDSELGSIQLRIKETPGIIVSTTNRKRGERGANQFDIDLINRIDNTPIQAFIPTDELPNGYNTEQPKRSYEVHHVHQFFTRRNLIALAKLREKISLSPYASPLRFVFTSMIGRSMKLNRFSPRNYFFGGGGWVKGILNGTLYIPTLPVEVSVLEQLSGKINMFDSIRDYLPSNYNNVVDVMSACSVPIRDNSVDYIFTDPPFGANIMYSELNYVQEAWLRVRTNNATEAIVNKEQNKGLFEYQQLMNRSLREYYRILKPGKWLTMEFSNTSASVWNSIQNALQGVGFVVAGVAALDKQLGSFKAVTTTTAVKQDLVITCFKPTESFIEQFEANAWTASSVWDFIDEFLAHLPVHLQRENATTAIVERSPKILYDRVVTYYVQKGLPVPIDASEFQIGLRERYSEEDGMFFTPGQLAEYREKKKTAPEFLSLGLIVSNESDGIEWLRNQLREGPKTYQQLSPEWMQAISGLRKGDILPELMEILEENFIQEEDGFWRLPNIQDDVDKDKLREKALLREFRVYVEAVSKPKAKLKEVRVEAIRAGFKHCYIEKNFKTIVLVGDRIPQNLLTEDEILLQFYDIALSHV